MPPKPYIAPPFCPPRPTLGSGAVALALNGHYQVREYTCGFASVLTVLRYYQRFIDERELYRRLGTDHNGTSQNAIVRELRRQGIRVGIRYDMTFEDMASAIGGGRLIIGYHHPLEHWVVLYGYRETPQSIFVADSLKGHRAEHGWEHYGHKLRGFGIVCSTRPSPLMRIGENRHQPHC